VRDKFLSYLSTITNWVNSIHPAPQSRPPIEHSRLDTSSFEVRYPSVGQPIPTDESQVQEHAGVHGQNTDMDILLVGDSGERRRDRAKRFVVEKGPAIVGAAVGIGSFIFNIVSS
jgi:hypothetical protein